ncbi:MAG: hypothetical protein ACTH3E_10115 [Psychroflexus halocasei]
MKKTLYILLAIILIFIGFYLFVHFQKIETKAYVSHEFEVPEEIVTQKLNNFDSFRKNWPIATKTDSVNIVLNSNKSSYSSIELLPSQNNFPEQIHFKNWLSDQFVNLDWTVSENKNKSTSVTIKINTQIDFFDKLNQLINKETAIKIAEKQFNEGLKNLEENIIKEMQSFNIKTLENKRLPDGFLLKSPMQRSSDLYAAVKNSNLVFKDISQAEKEINISLNCILINKISSEEVQYQIAQIHLIEPELSHDLINVDYNISRIENQNYTRHRLLGNYSNIDKLWYESFQSINQSNSEVLNELPIIYMLSKDNQSEINPSKWHSELWIPIEN